MEATGDQEGGNSEDLTGKKKPKLHILKSRLFGKAKRKGNEGLMKQSQSASDIREGMRDLEDDSHCSQSMMGSRALSHDSIFLADECQSDPEPSRVLSQENIHGKIRALQMKLQQQNMHLGPPPLMLPIKRTEDPGGSSEDDGLPHSPPEILGLHKNMPYKFLIPLRNHSSLSLCGTGSEEEEQSPLQPSSQPVSPRPISSSPVPVSPSEPCPGVDFNTLPQFVPCLDNSAARHRMSIKPRNQRASTKNRRLPTSAGYRPRSESMNNLERPLTESEQEEGAAVIKEMTRVRSYSSQIIRTGEGLSTPPIKSPLPVSPLKSLVGAGDGSAARAISHPEGSISATNTSFQHYVPMQQAPAREAASGLKSEAATAAVVTKQVPGSAVPPPKKWSGELRETPYSSTLKSAQDSTVPPVGSAVSTTPISSVGSDQNQPQSEKRSCTILTHDKRDTLNKNVIMQEDNARGLFPPASSGGMPLRPPSLRRNTSPLDEKVVARNLQQISPAHIPGQVGQLQKKSADQQRPISGSFRFSASSEKSNERHRTGSFTGLVGHTAAKREPAQDQFESVLAQTARKDPTPITEYQRYETRSSSSSALTKPKDPTPTISSAGRERGDSRASDSQETGVEATEEELQEVVEEAVEASEDLKGNEANEEAKEEEEKNAFGVKLRTTSLSLKFRADKPQSELRVKQHSAGVSSNPPWLMASTTPPVDGQKDSSVGQSGPTRGNMAAAVSKKVQSAEGLISDQVSSSLPQSVSRDKERTAPPIVDDFGTQAQHSFHFAKSSKFVHPVPKENTPVSSTSEESTLVSFPTKVFTPVCSAESIPTIPTTAKQPQDTSFELSWMSMAREKTRSLQQMFTSRLPDFSSLQTTTRSMNMTAPPPQTQTSTSQPSVGPLQSVSTQPSETQAPTRGAHSAQPPGIQSSIRSSEPTALKSGAADFSLKKTASQAQTEHSVRAGQLLAATSVQTTALTAHTAKHQLSQPLSQAQYQASQGTTQSNLRSTQPTQLPSSPKLTPHQTSQDSGSLLLQSRAQMGGDASSTALVKGNWTPVPQGKGPVESNRAQWAGGLGGKAFLAERWDHRTPDTAKVEDQKFTPESRPAPLAAFRATSSPSKTTESAASSVAMRMDREDKWQKKTVPPSSSSPSSSSSPPQSISDSGQPSWMELAKRKSLAWSDKTMD